MEADGPEQAVARAAGDGKRNALASVNCSGGQA